MNHFHFNPKIITLLLGVCILAACTRLTLREETPTPSGPGSISGAIRPPSGACDSLWVFAHEMNTQQVSHIQTRDGDCTYTLANLPPGDYLVVGWYYPGGVSGAYTALDTLVVTSSAEAQACRQAITRISLAPGEQFEGADLGCWGGDFFDIAETGGQIRLDPNRWRLVGLGGQPLLPGTSITLLFEGGNLSGSAGCNHYGGTYTSSPDGGFALGEVALTAMLCIEPDGVMEQEQRYLQALLNARSHATLDGELHLQDEAGAILLTFELLPSYPDATPADLAGVTWQLVAAPGITAADLGAFTLRFEGQGFSGTTTCRDYAGTFRAEQDRLRIGFLEMTSDENCGDDQMGAEGAFTTLLENVEQYHLAGNRLVLVTLQSQELVFERVQE